MKISILVIALLSGQYQGDNANIQGISKALKAKEAGNIEYEFSEVTISKKEQDKYVLDEAKIKEIQVSIDKGKPTLVLGAGLDGVESFEKLTKSYNSLFIWSGHQIPKIFKNFEDVNAIIVPNSALDQHTKEEIGKQTKLITTIGVPHNKSKADINKAYEEWSKGIELPPHNGFLFVALPGDAPDEHGVQHYHTKESAAKLGTLLGAIATKQNMLLLATNGPRTGKFDPKTGEAMPVHHKGEAMDAVSSAFLAAAEDAAGKSKVIFADFKFGSPSLTSAFLGAVASDDRSVAVIAGESTSQVTEAVNLLNPGQVYVLPNEAMNKNHEQYIAEVINNNYAKELKESDESLTTFSTSSIMPPDADVAADGIMGLISSIIKVH